jgi:glycosyltransferase involved in cell wall biosynthesis
MKVAVLVNWAPFVSGGAERLADALTRKLAEYGHQSMLFRLPFAWQPPGRVLDHMLACRSMRLPNVDRAICLKFPAWFVPHPHKVLWLLHQFRQAYDLWDTGYQDLPATAEGLAVRDSVIRSDNAFLPECSARYAISPVVAARLKKFNGLDAGVLYHPLPESSHFRCEEPEDYVFCPGRITAGKRQHLLAEAMRFTRTPVRLVIAGVPETRADLDRVAAVVSAHNLQDRVCLMPGFLPEAEKANLFARALACAYTPYDEDSYGYVTLEACHSRKPVVTLTDSGGIHILVEDGVTGWVRTPDPRDIADALDRIFDDKPATRRMGQTAWERMLALRITWDHVVATLTS